MGVTFEPDICRMYSVKGSDVTGNPFEWLPYENNVIQVPLPHTSLY